MRPFNKLMSSASVLSVLAASASAAQFTLGDQKDLRGSFDSTITLGTGLRTARQSPDLITGGNTGGPAGQQDYPFGVGDQGDLNYARGDFFTQYLKGSHELLIELSRDTKFMARANWLKDWAAPQTSGYLSTTPTSTPLEDGFASDARKDARFKARLLDFWVSKSIQTGDQVTRFRLGNQVISWGESLFLPGGINSTNAVDIQRLSQPGTQLKEAVLPAPMLSVASGLGHGLNVEAYLQFRWNKSYFPPTGTYWSTSNGLGLGHEAYGLAEKNAKKTGQWGVSLRWQPADVSANFGIYALNYHDKTPNFTYRLADAGHAGGWTYLEDRRLYGVSGNFGVGDWALGTELSYRPRDAVALNGLGSCNGLTDCWVEEKRYQWHGTALFSATPSNAKGLLDLLGASTATLMLEAVAVSYPTLQQTYNNGSDYVAAGGWFWTDNPGHAGNLKSMGSKTSWGYNVDFSWVYDGSLIPGWQLTPEIYLFHAVNGRTPNGSGQFMKGAKSVNFIMTFAQNPATWQFGFNYAKFWGGETVLDQPLRDRDFVGAYISRNF